MTTVSPLRWLFIMHFAAVSPSGFIPGSILHLRNGELPLLKPPSIVPQFWKRHTKPDRALRKPPSVWGGTERKPGQQIARNTPPHTIDTHN